MRLTARSSALVLAAALALPAGALAAAPKPAVTPNPVREGHVAVLTGTLADRYGNPVVGAKVAASGGYGPPASGTTGTRGQFALMLQAERPGRWPVTVRVAGGKAIRFPMELLVEGADGKVPGAAPTHKGGGSVKGRAWPPWSRWVAGVAASAAAGAAGWWLLNRRRRDKWARPW
jgi:hypothetical protein